MRNNIFYHLAPVFRVTLFIFLCFVCVLPFGLVVQLNLLPPAPNQLLADISAQASLVVVVISASLMIFRILPYLDFYAIFVRKEKALSGFLKGSVIGLVFMGLCALLLYLNGNVSFSLKNIAVSAVLLYLVYFLLIAVFEEMLFRAYPLFAFAERYPVWFTIFFNGILFALAHFGNPNFTALGLFNILLAGVLFCIYTLQRKNISWAIGIHFGWNFTQGVLLGYNVSGNEMPGALKATPIGSTYLSGGAFGIEGSIFCTALLMVWIAWLIYRKGFGEIEIYDPQVKHHLHEDE
ncbi:CPBP family intramembrane glutamic endopeptidase [Pedobacter chitinilyticus]|uniref:CPBP family intramembrane metalloprotease n=1 Tax=Pedobacter chitinilyticus TaxID=2233776 RepID=A0A443Z2E8_9SPHI|nr:type II CAAX endopeptidase family protein [Pedobacter chitinilyticus]RWU10704.1 CPBP family intramembrane metalloprotease [Pedobacter chitinilyticus]